MIASQVIGSMLNSVTAITAITSTRIYNGSRPTGTTVPCINYFEMAGGLRRNGFERISYSINCRATTAETALRLATLVDELFNGTSGNGIYGYLTNFEVSRASTRQRQGLIPEPDGGLYNAPVDIFIVFPSSSIS